MCCWTSSWSSVVFGSRSAFFLEIPVPCAFCVASDFWMAALMVSWGNQSIDVRLLSSSDVILNEVTDGQACPYKPIWPQRESQATQAGTARPSLRPLRASPFPAKGPNGALRERPRPGAAPRVAAAAAAAAGAANIRGRAPGTTSRPAPTHPRLPRRHSAPGPASSAPRPAPSLLRDVRGIPPRGQVVPLSSRGSACLRPAGTGGGRCGAPCSVCASDLTAAGRGGPGPTPGIPTPEECAS